MADTENPQTQTTGGGGWKSWFHLGWIKTPIGVLKLLELVLIFLGLCIMSSVSAVTGGTISSIEFFIFVNTTVFVFLIITIVLYIINMYHKLPAIMTSNIVMLVACGLASLMLLICSAVPMGKWPWHDTILAAGSFGIMAMFLFIFETIYYLIKFRREGANPQKNSSAMQNDTVTDFEEPPPAY